jgi:hypothetical protein
VKYLSDLSLKFGDTQDEYVLKRIASCSLLPYDLWLQMQSTDPPIKEFELRNQFWLKPLNLFDSLFGGCVETFKMLVNDESKKIKYKNVNFLYPFVNATKCYPVGHPIIIAESFGDPQTVCGCYFGIIYCKVLQSKCGSLKYI